MIYFIRLSTLIALFVLLSVSVFAQSPTDSTSSDLDAVDKLKEKVAEKVEELKDKNEKAAAGQLIDMSEQTWTLKSPTHTDIDIDIDGTLTDFFEISGTKIKELKREDIKKNDYVFVTGPEIGDAVTANAAYREQPYMVLSGKMSQANADDFTIHVVTVDKTNYIFDIERATKQQMLDIKSLDTSTIGFSKLKEGDSVHVVVKANPADPKQTRFSAVKVLVIPNEYFLQ